MRRKVIELFKCHTERQCDMQILKLKDALINRFKIAEWLHFLWSINILLVLHFLSHTSQVRDNLPHTGTSFVYKPYRIVFAVRTPHVGLDNINVQLRIIYQSHWFNVVKSCPLKLNLFKLLHSCKAQPIPQIQRSKRLQAVHSKLGQAKCVH